MHHCHVFCIGNKTTLWFAIKSSAAREKELCATIFLSQIQLRDVLCLSKEEFEQCWLNDANGNGQRGLALLLYPTPALYDQEDAFPKEKEKRLGLGYFYVISRHIAMHYSS